MVRPLCSPGWAAVMTNPGTKLYLCPAKARRKTAFDGKPREWPHFSALPLEGTHQVSHCVCASKVNLKLELFMKSKTLTSAVRVPLLLLLVSATGALAQDRRQVHLSGLINDYSPLSSIAGSPWEMHGQWSMDLHPEWGTADFAADMTMSGYGKTSTGAV